MGEHLTYAGWFVWGYPAVFAVLSLLSVWWLVNIVRRPVEQFPAGWPYPKLRWGLIPAAWLVAFVLQTVQFGLAFLKVRMNLGSIGLVTFALGLAVVVFGIAYLLRVVYPREPRGGDAEGGGHGEGEGEPHVTAQPVEHPEDEPVDLL